MKLQFESSTFCNARCTFCPRYEMTRPMGQMSDELFHKIIKEGKELGITTYLPFLNGEPFIFPRIYEWLDYMEKEGVRVILYTNAELMDVDRLIKYKNIDLVNCSFNGATKETYEKVMPGLDYDIAKKNIEDLIAKSKFRIRVTMVVVDENVKEKALFRKMWGERTYFAYYNNWGGKKPREIEATGIQRPCVKIFNNTTILWDGRVNLCCMDYDGEVIFGDLNKEHLKDILEKMMEIKKRHKKLDFDMPLCKNCNANKQ